MKFLFIVFLFFNLNAVSQEKKGEAEKGKAVKKQEKPAPASLARAQFKTVGEYDRVSIYEHKDYGLRVIKRDQVQPVKENLNRKQIREIARVRFLALEKLGIGFKDFKVLQVYKKPIQLNNKVQGFAWEGSYKNKQGERKFFKEFITNGVTWNVFASARKNLKRADLAVQSFL